MPFYVHRLNVLQYSLNDQYDMYNRKFKAKWFKLLDLGGNAEFSGVLFGMKTIRCSDF